MVRNRTIVPARYGGTCAVDETDVEEVAPCNPEPCPVECVLGDWDEWASCTASCAGGTKTRERAVVTAAQHGGDECGNTTETIPCNLFACPTPQPTPMPTPQPTPQPTPHPTPQPSPQPTTQMPSTSGPSARPTTPLPTVGYVETVKLGLSNREGSQQFGSSVAISSDGNLVAVGAERSSATGDDTGGAYVFRTSDDGASWVQVAELVESDAEGALGEGAKSVAIAGDFVAVGKRGTKTVYVFRTADDGATWSQVAKLTPTTIGTADWFGGTVAISSDLGVVVAGAGGETDWPNGLENQGINQCGAVYVFRTTDGGATWQQTARLTKNGAGAYDAVGSSVAISGNIIAAGAHQSNGRGPDDSGSVYIFRTDDGGAAWTQVSEVYAADGAYQDLLGRCAVDGNILVAGAPLADAGSDDSREGAAYIFRTDDNGSSWTQVAKLTARDAWANDNFGSSVAIAGNLVAVGSQYDDDGGSASGSVYLYQTDDNGATWYEIIKLRASDAAQADAFSTVSISGGGRVVVGARLTNSQNYGSVYIFDTPAPTPQPTTAQPTPGPTPRPSPVPSPRPTPSPTVSPTPVPTPRPTTASPSVSPGDPTRAPVPRPSPTPTLRPTPQPTTAVPSAAPTSPPSLAPSPSPTLEPSPAPTRMPTREPCQGGTYSADGFAPCTECNAGSYSGNRATSCELCADPASSLGVLVLS